MSPGARTESETYCPFCDATTKTIEADWKGVKVTHRSLPHCGVCGRLRARYNFVDLTGKTIAGCKVIQRAASAKSSGNARWHVMLPCGIHSEPVEGIKLRACEKNNRLVRCWTCRPKGSLRPGRPYNEPSGWLPIERKTER